SVFVDTPILSCALPAGCGTSGVGGAGDAAEDVLGVLPQELRPDVVAERDVRQLREDPIERQPCRPVPGVQHLVRATAVRELEDLLVVVLRREGGGRVVE